MIQPENTDGQASGDMAQTSGDMELILDHFRRPRNYGAIEHADVDHELRNPACGDHVRMLAAVGTDGRLTEACYVGNGCVISMAAASLLTTLAQDAPLTELVKMPEEKMLEALEASISPRRVDCALLAFRALRSGLVAHYHDARLRSQAR